ncbi:permease prefix domain 1-containing protein [Winogradskyella costae]|uniref:permease prefix domain 1-containing protein n=1 Tax=Winogradskyella costae TaxID=2697008 RepID=UPI0015C87CB2|nr:permease prefix domain 1-containing protein [Winogradskyella costae]
MENRTEFNLNKNIEIWKSELSQKSNMTKDNINELESHLRDEIHELKLLGLNTEESLLIAEKRIGNVEDLSTEFGKINKGIYFRNKIIPYLKGILLFFAFVTIIDLMTNLIILITEKTGLNNTNTYDISIVFLILLTITLLIISYRKYKSGNFNMQKLTNIPTLVTIIVGSKILSDIIISTSGSRMMNFASLQISLKVYKYLFALFILAFSCLTYYYSKKDNKIEISE